MDSKKTRIHSNTQFVITDSQTSFRAKSPPYIKKTKKNLYPAEIMVYMVKWKDEDDEEEWRMVENGGKPAQDFMLRILRRRRMMLRRWVMSPANLKAFILFFFDLLLPFSIQSSLDPFQ